MAEFAGTNGANIQGLAKGHKVGGNCITAAMACRARPSVVHPLERFMADVLLSVAMACIAATQPDHCRLGVLQVTLRRPLV